MQRITITQFSYQPAVQDFVGTVTGVIDVEDQGACIRHGGEGWLRVRVPDAEADRSIGVEDDPLRWAALFPAFVAGGDTEVTVETITSARGEQTSLPDVATPALAALSAAVHSH